MIATLALVNKALKELGIEERLRRGRGYFYFWGGDAPLWFTSGVYGVGEISHTTVQWWLQQWSEMSGKPVPVKKSEKTS